MSREFVDPLCNVASVGPFERFPVVVNGYLVPKLQAIDLSESVQVVFDDRWALDVPHELAGQVLIFLADVIAVMKGHQCHPGPVWTPETLPNGQPPAYAKLLPLPFTGQADV